MLVLSAVLESDALPGDWMAAWSWPLVPLISLVIVLAVYLRGWRTARRTRAEELPVWRAACFATGIAALWIALASPIDALDDYLLAAHMMQHFILMSVAPPLLIFGAPAVPLLRGLPRGLIRAVVGPLLKTRTCHAVLRTVTHPMFAWMAMNIAYLGWHVPAMFELTFRSEWIHNFEHLCFFWTSIAFWWVVILPWPARVRWPRWTMIPYLLTADVLNTVLSATLVFAGKVLYSSYAAVYRISRLTPQQDQAAAGAEMWVLNSIVFLVPAVVITFRMLIPAKLVAENVAATSAPR